MSAMIIFSVLQSLLPDLAEKVLPDVHDALDVLEGGVEGEPIGPFFLFVEEGVAGDGGGG